MTTERFFGGLDERTELLRQSLAWVADSDPTEAELVGWIAETTPAGSEEVILRNIRFLESIDVLERVDEEYALTNKGEAFVKYDEPQVIYEGLEKAVDGFQEIVRSIAVGRRSLEEIQTDLQAHYPDYVLPEGVVSKHLDWLISLDLVTKENGDYVISIEGGEFDVGETYNRWFIHDVFKGERYKGIATPSEYPLIFVFTGESGKTYGYEDKFLEDDTFLYTGEGTEGDMTMDRGNEAIRDHRQNGESIHLFESTELPWIVTYLGEYEYVRYKTDELEDENGELRDALRFYLRPVGGSEVEIEAGSPSTLSDSELFQKAKKSTPTTQSSSSGGSAGGGRTYQRSAVVREFALRMADGICQGCNEEAPFVDRSGRPFLEVHHLTRRSDGGPDDPENVIAICPNCHRRVHEGRDGPEFNQDLKRVAEARNEEFL